MLTRRPPSRPWDVMALEVALTVGAALEVGLLLWLADDAWQVRGAQGAPVLGVVIVVALAAGGGWLAWLLDRGGWLLASTSAIAGILAGALLLLGAAGADLGLEPWPLLLVAGLGAGGVAGGVALPSPLARRPRQRARGSASRLSPRAARAVRRLPRRAALVAAARSVPGRMRRSGAGAASAPAPEAGDVEVAAPPMPATRRPATPDVPSVAAPGAARTAPTPPEAGRAGAPTPGKSRHAAGRQAGAAPQAPMDPGAIARAGRASIDAELAAPRAAPRHPAPPPVADVKAPFVKAPPAVDRAGTPGADEP